MQRFALFLYNIVKLLGGKARLGGKIALFLGEAMLSLGGLGGGLQESLHPQIEGVG